MLPAFRDAHRSGKCPFFVQRLHLLFIKMVQNVAFVLSDFLLKLRKNPCRVVTVDLAFFVLKDI